MASVRKSFNFRNGIQVDDDNFIINANGLVGIGTSVPTEILDVNGTIKANNIVVDDISAANVSISDINGISTFSKLITNDYINVGVTSITSGIITSYTGVVTYYGDGGRLLNLPTSQWLDVDVGLGFTSIYSQGYVGIATNDPRYVFQIGGRYSNPSDLSTLIEGVGFSSNGNIRATGIVTAGYFYGDGASITGIDASNITLGTLPDSIFADTVVVNNINASGIITSATYFYGSLVGIASTARDITSESSIEITGLIVGVSTINDILHAKEFIGIGTNARNIANDSDLYIEKSGAASVSVVSENAASFIRIGRDGDNVDGNGEIRFGNIDNNYDYSNSKSFDIINYDDGNLNYYNNVVGGSGDFNWIKGLNVNLMTLTSDGSDGKLGIGTTLPAYNLEVIGTGKVSSDFHIGGNLTVIGDATLSGLFEVTDEINVTGNAFFNTLGVATDSTSYDLQIGLSPDLPNGGVGISSNGYLRIRNDIPIVRDINSSGIITASSFFSSGNITGDSFSGTGTLLTDLDASNISIGTLVNDRLPDDINVSGVITATEFVGIGSQLINLDATSITTGTLDNARLPSDIAIGGNISAGGTISATEFVGIGSQLSNLDASGITTGTLDSTLLSSEYGGNSISNLESLDTSNLTVNNKLTVNSGVVTFSGIVTCAGDVYSGSSVFSQQFIINGQYLRWGINSVSNELTFIVGISSYGYIGITTLNLLDISNL